MDLSAKSSPVERMCRSEIRQLKDISSPKFKASNPHEWSKQTPRDGYLAGSSSLESLDKNAALLFILIVKLQRSIV